jgi:hypothetical protein
MPVSGARLRQGFGRVSPKFAAAGCPANEGRRQYIVRGRFTTSSDTIRTAPAGQRRPPDDFLRRDAGAAGSRQGIRPGVARHSAHEKLTGAYSFGPTPADRLEITANKEQLSIARPGRFPRGLFHLGSLELCPVGAENIRIRFTESAGAMVLTVHDPDVVLDARKSA